jgi:UDP-GlcNAc:undecaprenyl-phosphate/decaprenyl-phosphate GlcNAc-1-phosphate transferase
MSFDYILLIYLFISFSIFIVISKVSYKLNLLDIPNKRKIHSKPTAYTGGLAISIAYLFSLKLFEFGSNDLSLIVSIGFLIAIVGFIDDKYNLNTGGKLSLQIIPIIYLIFFVNLKLSSIGDYDFFRLDLNTFSIPCTLFCVLFLINAFNYFDGIDGSLSITVISVIIILYFLTSDNDIKLFLIIFLIPILIFLLFNFGLFNLPKLFLGDNGSLLIGFLVSFILIFYANQKLVHPILLAWSVAIFVYEFLSINLERLINKKHLFVAGLDHLHHKLLKKNKSILLTDFLLFVINIILFIIGYASFKIINSAASLILFIFFFIIFYYIKKKIFS